MAALISRSLELQHTPPRNWVDPILNKKDCYEGIMSGYTNCLQGEHGAFNLLDSISNKFIETEKHMHPIKTIRIRRLQNDELFPYDAATFLNWYEQFQTDPVTREDLSYIANRVKLKHERLLYFDKDLLYRIFCSTSLQKELFQELVRVGSLKWFSSQYLLPLRVCIDPKSLEDIGYLWDLDCSGAEALLKNKPSRTWLIRRSSTKNTECLMKNAELVTISRRKMVPISSTDTCLNITQPKYRDCHTLVFHARFLHVIGVGWYSASVNLRSASSFLRFVTEMNIQMEPSYSCFIDLIDSHRQKNHLQYSQLLNYMND